MTEPTTLTAITWNHTRGWLPLAAAAQRFMDARPDVRITWEKRSLQEFADYPIERLAERFARALLAASRRGTQLGDELGKD